MSPGRKRDELRREQIVAIAAEVLYERGIFDTRINDIAVRAGMSAPTVLYYFESKDRLLEQAVEYADREFYARLNAAQAQLDTASEKLVRLIEDTSLGPAAGLSDYTLWMDIWVRARRDASVRKSYFRLDRRQRALIIAVVEEGQRGGEFDADVDPDDFAVLLSGLLDGLGVQVTLGRPDIPRRRMVDSCLALASSQLGCELRPSRPAPRRRRRSGSPAGSATGQGR